MPNLEDDGDAWEHAVQPFDPEMEVEGEVGNTWRAPAEAQAPKAPAVPKGPTEEQKREHELQGHVKYESWCPHCVAGKGRAVGH